MGKLTNFTQNLLNNWPFVIKRFINSYNVWVVETEFVKSDLSSVTASNRPFAVSLKCSEFVCVAVADLPVADVLC